MRSVLISLMLVNPVLAGGFCPPVYHHARPLYKAPVNHHYKAPVKHHDFHHEEKITIIIKPVLYPLAAQGKDFFSYSLQDQLEPLDLQAVIEGQKAVQELQIQSTVETGKVVTQIVDKKQQYDQALRELVFKREIAQKFVEALQATQSSGIVATQPLSDGGGGEVSAFDPNQIIVNECAKCHVSGNREGLPVLSDWDSLDETLRERVRKAVAGEDGVTKMPPNKALSFQQLMSFQ